MVSRKYAKAHQEVVMPIGSDVRYTTLASKKKEPPEPRGKRKLLMVTMKQLKKKQQGENRAKGSR